MVDFSLDFKRGFRSDLFLLSAGFVEPINSESEIVIFNYLMPPCLHRTTNDKNAH
jgi:hypothetical protein